MYQARVKAEARWPLITAGGGQHFSKSAFHPVQPGTEEEVGSNPDLEMEEVLPVVEGSSTYVPLSEGNTSDGLPVPGPAIKDSDPAPELAAMTKDQLATYAAERGISLKASATKADMVAAIESARRPA